jgi:hypothetical protein
MRSPNRGGHNGSRLERAMLGFVIRENIKHYRRLLETAADEAPSMPNGAGHDRHR